MHNGYAVIDFETTGLSPAHGHRVIEIGLVHVDPGGRIERSFETVVNPGRDLGPVHVHRLRGADMDGAPTFAEVAPTLVERLAGRVLVAHNAPFEARFLHAEFERLGLTSPFAETGRVLCTMRLALEFLPGSGRKLADCCSAYDIELVDAHEALADARATAELLGAYISSSGDRRRWADLGAAAAALHWPVLADRDVAWTARRRATSTAGERTRVDRATDRMPALGGGLEQTQYAAMLDAALADGLLGVGEAEQLSAIAREFRLDDRTRESVHVRYFEELVEAVWADGVLSVPEHIQLRQVARLLGIPDMTLEQAVHGRQPASMGSGSFSAAARVQTASSVTPPSPTSVTDADDADIHLDETSIVTLTGEMRRSRSAIEADLERLGIRTAPSVTKKTTVVIAADRDSLSGKARKARQYGIPIVEEHELERALRSA